MLLSEVLRQMGQEAKDEGLDTDVSQVVLVFRPSGVGEDHRVLVMTQLPQPLQRLGIATALMRVASATCDSLLNDHAPAEHAAPDPKGDGIVH